MLKSATILQLHDEATDRWHRNQPYSAGDEALPKLVLEQYRANFDLWHEEDEARSPAASAAKIAEVKHAIDLLNQRRNDLVEQIDAALLDEAGKQNLEAPMNSETPGLIVDRLSILALKIFHTEEQTRRESASQDHRDRNHARLEVLVQQRDDLAQCLDELWQQIIAGKRRFRLYRQMKMYNDPDLNPVLYRKADDHAETGGD